MTYAPPPPTGSILEGFEYFGLRKGRKIWRDGERFYTWDSRHHEVEVFNKRGWHLGALDPLTGVALKDAVKGRRLDV